ncbi:MAG: phenylalanine--tRNA ligase subunit beta [Pseudomonadota bacterium]
MKIAESWLREWVQPDLDTEALGHRLTMLGLELDGLVHEGEGLDGVVVGEVVEVEKHPNADRLRVCKVSTGEGEPLDVVCGAPNVVKGMKSPLATPGVRLPNGVKLRKSKIRGVESNGMLCSAVELGLGEESDGILALSDDAPVGESFSVYLGLPDAVFDLDLTPNRGDCFSVLGVARDVAALTGATMKRSEVSTIAPTTDDVQPVELPEPEGCPIFAGRIIRGIDPTARSPLWLVERLRRAGLREIYPVVDVTNYVMLELGQPLHGYDAAKIQGTIRPRLARAGETLQLLDEKHIELRDDTMVVTDDSGVIGLAGIMGGLSTAVTDATTDVYFEAAFWPQAAMAGRARSYGMHTDASLRFERGVDYEGQARAVERATGLLIEIAGGESGPTVVTRDEAHVPEPRQVSLRRSRLDLLLGTVVDDETVTGILERLELKVSKTAEGWHVVVPSHRFDIAIEADLIEEVARIHGYDEIPSSPEIAPTLLEPVTETAVSLDSVAATLVSRDYQEVVTYSFVDAGDDEAVGGRPNELILANPISSEMSAMRSSLLTGLLHTASSNAARQQERVRIFELGKSFHGTLAERREVVRVAGLAYGPRRPEQWGAERDGVDFFDIKADVEAILSLASEDDSRTYEAIEHPALQAGQAAAVKRDGREIGVVGKVHPGIAKRFGLRSSAFVFELDAEAALGTTVPEAKSVSRYPAIRRDIDVVVDSGVSAAKLIAAVKDATGALANEVRLFDVYQGPGIEAGRKSIAIGLILQETSRTLTNEEADAAQAAAVQKLEQEFAAALRD